MIKRIILTLYLSVIILLLMNTIYEYNNGDVTMQVFLGKSLAELIIAGIIALIGFAIAFWKLPNKISNEMKKELKNNQDVILNQLGKNGNLSNEHTNLSNEHTNLSNEHTDILDRIDSDKSALLTHHKSITKEYLRPLRDDLIRRQAIQENPNNLINHLNEYKKYIETTESDKDELREVIRNYSQDNEKLKDQISELNQKNEKLQKELDKNTYKSRDNELER